MCVCVIALECSKFAKRREIRRSSTNCEMTHYLKDNRAPAFSPNQYPPKSDFTHRTTFTAGASPFTQGREGKRQHHALTMVITNQRPRCVVSRYLDAPAALDKGPIAGVEVVSKEQSVSSFVLL